MQVSLHDAVALRITPLHPQPNHTDWRPWHGQPMYERHEEDEEWIRHQLVVPAAPGMRRDTAARRASRPVTGAAKQAHRPGQAGRRAEAGGAAVAAVAGS